MKRAKGQIQAKRPGVRGRPEDGGKVTYIRAINPESTTLADHRSNRRRRRRSVLGSTLLATNSCVVELFLVKCAAVEFSPDLFLARSTTITRIHLSGFRELYSSCHLLIILFVYSRSGIRSEQVLVLVKTDVFNFYLSQIERELIFDDCVLVFIYFSGVRAMSCFSAIYGQVPV
jgi:hypothetical protein